MRAITAYLTAFLLVVGCTEIPQVARSTPNQLSFPSAKSFGPAPAPRTNASNATLARDFMRLVFELESGREIPVFNRFEGAVSVRLTGISAHPTTRRDLDHLLARLRTEARLNIQQVPGDQPANISVELVPTKALRRTVPNAACFVAPNVSNWQDFVRLRGKAQLNWAALTERKTMAVFIPAGVSLQEIRDCLHEEIAQALGPVNDLYDLDDSVFNDDNFHTILTGYDMAILRAYYAPQLKSGMNKAAVNARISGILARQRPGYGGGGVLPEPHTPDSWKSAIEQALGANSNPGTRVVAARRAVSIAQNNGWRDNRLGFALFALARLSAQSDPELADRSLRSADEIFSGDASLAIHRAHVAVQRAAFGLRAGRAQQAIALADENAAIALRHQNAGLLATLLMIKTAALENLSQTDKARIVEQDALAWAQYAFGTRDEINTRFNEIRALAARSVDQGSS